MINKFLFPFIILVISFNQTAFGYGIEARGILRTYGQPVHETLTRNAALESGLFTESQELEMRYLIEGVRFNDDPEGYLLSREDGKSKKAALAFALKFLGNRKVSTDPTKASHFGDFQFLHAMGNAGETSEKIKEKLMLYAYHCWLVASGNETFESFKANYDIISAQLKSPVSAFSYNRHQIIIKKAVELFPKEVLFFHAENEIQFRYRAMGSLLHMV